MGIQKNATYKVHNGVDFDEINFKTIAGQVNTVGGSDVETELRNITNIGNIEKVGYKIDKKTGLIEQWGYSEVLKANNTLYGELAVNLPTAFKSESFGGNATIIKVDHSYLYACEYKSSIIDDGLGRIFLRVKGDIPGGSIIGVFWSVKGK